jgi:dGTPase
VLVEPPIWSEPTPDVTALRHTCGMAATRSPGPQNERSARWASTMAGFPAAPGGADAAGHAAGGVRVAHGDSRAELGQPATGRAGSPSGLVDRRVREEAEDATLAAGATRARGAGQRSRPEEPDPWRTCFERDRDRILHSTAFRRLAGKTQVFIFPEDHSRTRLTHALEVAQVATSVARACGLNVALAEAIALGHDCGHGPGGHASEDALSPFLDGGFDHASWGAAVSLASLNLCAPTLDGIANHSWSRPAPSSCEGEVVSWADRIAYVCHDWEDAVMTGIVSSELLDPFVADRCGTRRSDQLGTFVRALVTTTLSSGRVGMDDETAEALARFRALNYERIYLRDASVAQAESVVALLRALVEHFADRPNAIPSVRDAGGLPSDGPAALRAAVGYVAGMTDRFACRQAVALLGWDPAKLPRAIGWG